MTEPEWSDFKILVALARGGSVAGAARSLGVDHSTVSRRLTALEDSIGACLVVRGGRELTWTAEGRTLLATAEMVEAAVEQATRSVRAAKQETDGRVRLSCPPGLTSVLSRLFLELRDRYPQLTIELSAQNRAVDLTKGEADLALRMFRPNEPALICKQVLRLGWAVYASRAYQDRFGLPSSVGELPDHRLVRYVDAMHGVPGPAWLEAHRGCATGIMQVDNTEVAAQNIAAGAAIGVIPCIVAAMRPELVRVFDAVVGSADGYLVYHETMRDTARVRVAIEALSELFTAHEHEFSGGDSGTGAA